MGCSVRRVARKTAVCLLMPCTTAAPAAGFHVDDAHIFQLTGSASTQGVWRTERSDTLHFTPEIADLSLETASF